MEREQGITFPRMLALADLHARTTGRDLYNLGTAVALAFSDPKELKAFIREQITIDMDKLPAMLRATTKAA